MLAFFALIVFSIRHHSSAPTITTQISDANRRDIGRRRQC